MKPKVIALALAAALGLAVMQGRAEEAKAPNIDPAASGKKGGVAQMALAQDLYAIGMAEGDALIVLTAAKLAAGVDLTDVERELETRVGKTAEEPDGAAGPVDAATMLASAAALAGEDEVLAGLVEDVEAEGARGRIGGASRTMSGLPAGSVDTWKVPFYGNSYAELAVLGDGDSNLDVQVTDENGNVICFDVSGSDKVYCDFVPAWNGYFTVTVENKGTKRNTYDLLTN